MISSLHTWHHRATRRDAPLLSRVQWLFVLLNCLVAVLVPLDLTDPTAARGIDAVVVAVSFMGLGLWSVVYYRRHGESTLLDVVPLVLLFAGGVASGSGEWVFARMYIALFLCALYRPKTSRHLALSASYLVMYKAVEILIGEPVLVADIISEGVSLLVVTGIMQTLAKEVRRHERFATRDALLTGVVAGLLGERDRERINQVVTDAAFKLIGVPGALVTLWRDEGDHLQRVAMTGRTEHPLLQATLQNLPDEFRAIYEYARPVLLSQDQLERIHAFYDLPPEFVNCVIAPMLRDGESAGLLVAASPESIDPDVVPVFERFAHEVSLAQQLVERDAMLAGLVENSSDIIAVVSETGTLSYVSPAIRRTTRTEPDALVGASLSSLLQHAGTQRPLTHADELAPRTPVTCVLTVGDERCDVEVTANPLHDGATILNIRDISDRRRLEAEIEYRAFHDSVTELPNRALFLDRVDQALRRVDRDDGMVAVALVDIDDFKGVNDGLGHAAGDELLREIGRRLTATLRDVDTAARLGGDEFGLVLEGFTDTAQAEAVLDRLLASLRLPVTLEGMEVSVSASIGLTTTGHALQPQDLIRNADAAMYAAKKAGKNRRATFHADMHESGTNRLELRNEMEVALREGQFVLHYQPVMGLGSGDVVGVEALVRWNHPARGILPPAQFIPMAEETGLIVELGEWVLHEACTQVSQWGDVLPQPVQLSVNLSAVQLRSRDVIDHVEAALLMSGLEPARLTLELTETALMGDPETMHTLLTDLKALGVRIAIDDFGTGYSSFAHLQRLPVDVIKVDRSFVSVLSDGPEQAALAHAIVTIAQTLGLDTVAEGVEVDEHRDLLRSWGCSYAQGWLWHAALPADEAVQVLASSSPVAAR